MKESPIEKKVYQLHSELCKTLSHPKRLEILNHLRDGEKSAGELVSLIGSSKANLSQHLAVLRQRRIVSTRREGVNIFYRIANPKIIKACDIIREVLFEQLVEDDQMRQAMESSLPITNNC
ncbi:MAG: ArsR/SmtB family transcription factor [bacterium]